MEADVRFTQTLDALKQDLFSLRDDKVTEAVTFTMDLYKDSAEDAVALLFPMKIMLKEMADFFNEDTEEKKALAIGAFCAVQSFAESILKIKETMKRYDTTIDNLTEALNRLSTAVKGKE